MEDVFATFDRFAPSIVGLEVGGEEIDVVRLFDTETATDQHRTYVRPPVEIAHSSANAMPGPDQRQNAVTRDVARPACHQNCRHRVTLSFVGAGSPRLAPGPSLMARFATGVRPSAR
jgi:hypothetical protein